MQQRNGFDDNQSAALDGMPHADPGVWYPRLTRLLDQQCELCAELEALSTTQSVAVGAGDTDALLRVLGQREIVVDRVTKINRSLEPFRTAKEQVLGRLQQVQRDAVMQRVGRIAALVESVRARDDQDRVQLERQRNAVGNELAALSRGAGAAAAYGASYRGVNVAPKYQDRNG